MEQQQSAVIWLAEEFDRIEKEFYKESTEYSDAKATAITLAEFMFKEQIIEARYTSRTLPKQNKSSHLAEAYQYFDKTFNAE